MTVRRIFVEKRQGYFDIPAQQLCDDLKETFRLDELKAVRIIRRYDIEGLSDEEFAAGEKCRFLRTAGRCCLRGKIAQVPQFPGLCGGIFAGAV